MLFLPLSTTKTSPNGAWAAIRLWLSDLGLPTTGRRIQALVCGIEGVDHVLAVGRETPFGDLAVVILESRDLDLFEACPELGRRICTPGRGVLEDIPYPLALDERWRVIDFEEEVVGHG